MKIRIMNINFQMHSYIKTVLLVVSILSFALKSLARFVDYNYRTIVEFMSYRGDYGSLPIHMQQLANIPD